MGKENLLSEIQSELPPIIARGQVPKLLGGVISAKTLANLDSEGKGPKRIRIGRKVAYRREDLVEFLEKRAVNLN
jgi:predicted DNA-binding transcriptional regulator AlpA